MNKLGGMTGVCVAAVVLGACSGVIVEDNPGPRWSYFDGDFEFATHKGAIVAEVTGNPFGQSPEEFARIVRSYMRNQVRVSTPAEFVSAHSDHTVPPYKVVVAFNAPPAIGGHGLCKSGALTPSIASAGTIRTAIAFCFGDSLKSEASGRVSGVTGAADDKFRSLVQEVTLAMIPAQDSEDQGEGDDGGNVPD